MPTKRTPIHRASKGRITPQAVALYRQIGVHEAAISDLRHRLSRALGRAEPWRIHILDAVDDEPPSWVTDKRDWAEANQIRQELEAAEASTAWPDALAARRDSEREQKA